MKSRVSVILALLVVVSVGLAEPLHAADWAWLQTEQMSVDSKERPSSVETGPGDSGETQGDPDGWLGGQNLRPTPPVVNGMALEEPDSPLTGLRSLFLRCLMLFGLR